METLTIRRLDPSVKDKLKRRAARHGRSMEAEARDILGRAVEVDEPEDNFAVAIIKAFAHIPAEDIPDFPRDRDPVREVSFD